MIIERVNRRFYALRISDRNFFLMKHVYTVCAIKFPLTPTLKYEFIT